MTDAAGKAFGDKITKLMAERALSPSDVARAIWGEREDVHKKTGKVYKTAKGRDRISNYMNGQIPHQETMQKLANFFQVELSELVPELVHGVSAPTPEAEVSITNIAARQDMSLLQLKKVLPTKLASQIARMVLEYESNDGQK